MFANREHGSFFPFKAWMSCPGPDAISRLAPRIREALKGLDQWHGLMVARMSSSSAGASSAEEVFKISMLAYLARRPANRLARMSSSSAGASSAEEVFKISMLAYLARRPPNRLRIEPSAPPNHLRIEPTQESVFLFTKLSGKSAYFLCPAAQR
jgi:hypothetical protein